MKKAVTAVVGVALALAGYLAGVGAAPLALGADAPPATTTAASPPAPTPTSVLTTAQTTTAAPATSSAATTTAAAATTAAPATTTAAATTTTAATTPAPRATKPPPPPRLTVSSAVTPTEGTVGVTLTYTLSLKNTSKTGTGMTVVDALPDGVALIAADADQGGTCTSSGPQVTCTWDAVNPNVTATATVVVQAVATGSIANSFDTRASDPTTTLDSGPAPPPVGIGQGVGIRFASTASR